MCGNKDVISCALFLCFFYRKVVHSTAATFLSSGGNCVEARSASFYSHRWAAWYFEFLQFHSVSYSVLLNRHLRVSELCCRDVLQWPSGRYNPSPALATTFYGRQFRITLCVNWAFSKESVNHYFNKMKARSRTGLFPELCTSLHCCMTFCKMLDVSMEWGDMVGSDIMFWKASQLPWRYQISFKQLFVNLCLLLSWGLCLPLGIFECERKSLLPNSWKYESLCDGEEQMRSWGLFWHSSGGWPQTECGLGWWMREVVVLGWRSKVAKRSGHTCYLQGHTHSWCICMTDCRQTVVFK